MNLKKMREERKYKRELERIDNIYGRGWTLFPPSFYLTHTKEEIEEATQKEIAAFRELFRRHSGSEDYEGGKKTTEKKSGKRKKKSDTNHKNDSHS